MDDDEDNLNCSFEDRIIVMCYLEERMAVGKVHCYCRQEDCWGTIGWDRQGSQKDSDRLKEYSDA